MKNSGEFLLDKGPPAPTYNHSREDGPDAPCKACRAQADACAAWLELLARNPNTLAEFTLAKYGNAHKPSVHLARALLAADARCKQLEEGLRVVAETLDFAEVRNEIARLLEAR